MNSTLHRAKWLSLSLLFAASWSACSDGNGGDGEPNVPEPSTPECEAGFFATSDGADCEPCPEGHFCLGGDAAPAAHFCEENEYIVSASATADERTCAPITQCGTGLVAALPVVTDGSGTEDVRCCDLITVFLTYENPSDLPAPASGCLVIDGELHIGSARPFPTEVLRVSALSFEGNGWSDLSILSDIQSAGTLVLNGAGGESLEALHPNLVITLHIGIFNGQSLASLDGFPTLMPNASMAFGGLPNLNDLSVLEGFTEISTLSLWGPIGDLDDLSALRNVTSAERITLGDLPGLQSLEGLSGLEELGTLYLARLANFETLSGIAPLSAIGTIELHNLPKVSSFAGLESVEQLGSLALSNVPALTSFDGLDALFDLKNLYLLAGSQNICQSRVAEFVDRFNPEPVTTMNSGHVEECL